MTKSNRKKISIVTPCYNEEENVGHHFDRVCKAIAPFRDKYDFEHIYTDNSSEDHTFLALVKLSQENPEVRILRFSRNIGADRAIYFGLQHTQGDAVILIQADLQDPPELIPEFIRGWEEGFDVVYGKITKRQEGRILQTFRNIYYKLIATLSDIPIPENAGEFRMTSRRALDALLAFKENNLYMRGAIAEVGYKQKALPYIRSNRTRGKSSVNLIYLFGYAINGLLSTTVVPIRIVSICGLAIAFVGFSFTATLVITKFLFPGAAPHGFTSLASLITFFSGAQMLSIGIIGEYIRKTYVETLRRPRGFIQDKINF